MQKIWRKQKFLVHDHNYFLYNKMELLKDEGAK